MDNTNNTSKQISLPIWLAITLAAGIAIGVYLVNPRVTTKSSSSSVSKFREVLSNIDRNYVDTVNANELVDVAITQMLEELDPHTVYVTADEIELANMGLKGGYDGIGVQFDIVRDTIVVVKPTPGGPSDNAGVRAGDRIVKVEGENVAGININTRGVTDRLLGRRGTKVNISVIHYGEDAIEDITITRGKITQNTVVASYMVKPEIGYIKLVSFGSRSHDEFKAALSDLKEQGMKKLIFDLQGNGGGYMRAAEDIADELIGGDAILVSQKGKIEQYNNVVRARNTGLFEEEAIIVLIDEYSASASEIVAGALQDNDRALIVGRRSYGKGLVQMPISLTDGSELRLTIARYYTPSGRSIQKPYVKGEGMDYAHDLMNRYEQGEFYYEDSIRFDDSLKYTTPKGRTVYGGGGIMPDHFVPFDSTGNTTYYNALINRRAIRELTLSYFMDNRQFLENKTKEEFAREFLVDSGMLNRLIQIGQELGIEYNENQFLRSRDHMVNYIKAEIARSIWDDAGFYPIYNEVSNTSYREALTLFNEAQALLSN